MLRGIATSIITPYEYRASDLLPEDKALKDVLTKAKIGKPMAIVLESYPSIKMVVHRLIRQVTHLYPCHDGSLPLLSRALIEGLAAYRKAGETATDQREARMRFVAALLARVAHVMAYEVRAVNELGEGVLWDPFSMPLHDWIYSKPAERRIVFTERGFDEGDLKAAQLMLCGQVLTMNDARLLQRFS